MQEIIRQANGKDFVLASLKEQCFQYDKKTVFEFLQAKGKQLFGKHFQLQAIDYELLFKLTILIIRDKQQCEKLNLNPEKGIFLTGPVGVGKTSFIRLIPYLYAKPVTQKFVSCRDIVFEFNQTGSEVIQEYATKTKFLCLDDLGAESIGRHFGVDCNVIAEVILSRYEVFVKKRNYSVDKHFTIITTNLNATEIEQRYGERVRSRIREMFNLFNFHSQAKDKRK